MNSRPTPGTTCASPAIGVVPATALAVERGGHTLVSGAHGARFAVIGGEAFGAALAIFTSAE